MKFCCPKCRREEEIIGDTKPKCLICHVGMVQATASYKGLWMSPHFVLARMKLLIEKYGYHDATTNGRFKKEREAWTSGMYALGSVRCRTGSCGLKSKRNKRLIR